MSICTQPTAVSKINILQKSTQIPLAQVGGFLKRAAKWVLLRSKPRWNLTRGNCLFFRPSFPGSISIFEGVIPTPTWWYMIDIPIRRQSPLIITTDSQRARWHLKSIRLQQITYITIILVLQEILHQLLVKDLDTKTLNRRLLISFERALSKNGRFKSCTGWWQQLSGFGSPKSMNSISNFNGTPVHAFHYVSPYRMKRLFLSPNCWELNNSPSLIKKLDSFHHPTHGQTQLLAATKIEGHILRSTFLGTAYLIGTCNLGNM